MISRFFFYAIFFFLLLFFFFFVRLAHLSSLSNFKSPQLGLPALACASPPIDKGKIINNKKLNSPLAQGQNKIPLRPLGRETSNLPPICLAVVFRSACSADGVFDDVMAGGSGCEFGFGGEAADDGHFGQGPRRGGCEGRALGGVFWCGGDGGGAGRTGGGGRPLVLLAGVEGEDWDGGEYVERTCLRVGWWTVGCDGVSGSESKAGEDSRFATSVLIRLLVCAGFCNTLKDFCAKIRWHFVPYRLYWNHVQFSGLTRPFSCIITLVL